MIATDLHLPTTADEICDVLSPELKGDVFVALLRELIRLNGNSGRIPVSTPEGEFLGSFVPAAAEKERYARFLADLSPAARDAMTRPLPDTFDPDDCLTDAELDAIRSAARSR
jgi:hypothetical protein